MIRYDNLNDKTVFNDKLGMIEYWCKEDNYMANWNPWRGCCKISEGCQFCYIHSGDAKRGVNTNIIEKTDQFYRPIEKSKTGNYIIKSNQIVYTCFNSDFFIDEADQWRHEVWDMIRKRQDLKFLFLTKRIDRFKHVAPQDFNVNFQHVMIGCSIENQKQADERPSVFVDLPIKHKMIICQPMIAEIDLSNYINKGIELVVVGGEAGKLARPLHYDWVLSIRDLCAKHHVNFEFRQLGSTFIKGNKTYKIPRYQLATNAKKANINLMF
jgi:protein gp37